MFLQLLIEWHKNGLPKDYSARNFAVRLLHLSVNQSLNWPLIFDPDDRLQLLIKVVAKIIPKFYTIEEESRAPTSMSEESTFRFAIVILCIVTC